MEVDVEIMHVVLLVVDGDVEDKNELQNFSTESLINILVVLLSMEVDMCVVTLAMVMVR